MSASKGKKKSNSKKLRVESTDNVLDKKELEEKKKEKNETNYKEQSTVRLDNIPEMNDSIKRLLESADKEEVKNSNNFEEINAQLAKEEEKKYKDKNTAKEIIKNIDELDDIQNETTKVVPSVTTDLVAVNDKLNKPDYVRKMLSRNKKKMVIAVSTVSLVLVAMFFSTIFAIINTGSTSIIDGIKIKDIDVSKLSIEQAKQVIEDATNRELTPDIKLKYNDYETTFNTYQIEFEYNIDEAIENAYNIGKSGNIVENNYSILLSTLFGKNIKINYSFNEELFDSFIKDVSKNIPGAIIEPSYCIEEDNLVVSKGTDGLAIDKEELKNEIINAILSRNATEIKDDSYSQIINLNVENMKALDIDMAEIYEEIHTEPKDAHYDLEPYKIYPDIDGVDLAVSVKDAQEQINKENKEEYTFKLNITKAKKTVSDLGLEAFPYLISDFSTKYDASNINRSTNLEIAASKINGKVLMPGEEFSFNKVVGKRTVEEGYKDAKIFANGGVTDGLAGGICQISSTLYNAVLLANLQISERYNHTYTTSYLPAGKDATVVWGAKDFKFVNSRSYPIKIEASVKNGIAEFKIHGIAEETEYEIKILPERTASIPYTTEYIDDPTLAPGQTVTKQAGYAGCKVTTYKEVRLNGNVISKEIITTDTYSPMKQIIRVGPAI